MKEDIFSRIKTNPLTKVAYIFILAWDDILKEKQRYREENPSQDPSRCELDHDSAIAEHVKHSILPDGFWDDKNKNLMLTVRKFLEPRLILNSDGSKKRHMIHTRERKNTYPVQMDIVDFINFSNILEGVYKTVSVQSRLSHELDKLMGIDKKSEEYSFESNGLIIRVNREYKPFSIQDKRAAMIEHIQKNVDALTPNGDKIFAKLVKDDLFDIGKGGVILFFEEDVKLAETKNFLISFIGENYVFDMFDVKGRLFVLLAGEEDDWYIIVKQLNDLTDAVYKAQNKPVNKSFMK